MKNVFATLNNDEKVKEIEKALDFIGTMVTQREDGDTYLVLYETLENELRSLRSQDDAKDRIRRRMADRAFKLAA